MSLGDSGLILLNSTKSQLRLDICDTNDNPPSVSFNIEFAWTMPFQSCHIAIEECWIDHVSLQRFESELLAFPGRENAFACLSNMSERPIIEVERNHADVLIRIHAEDTARLGNVIFTMKSSLHEVAEVYRRIREYPRWW